MTIARMKFEIDGLVEEMLDQIPESVWRDPSTTFLDPAMGGGQFIMAIIRRLKACGFKDSEIKPRVTGYEDNLLRVGYVAAKYLDNTGQVIPATLEKKDLVEFKEVLMKFDVIAGNPPYQEGNQGNYWFRFLTQSMNVLKPNGFCGYVIPATWGGVSSFKTNAFKLDYFRQYQVEEIDFTATNYFSVGIKICSIIIRNSKPTRPTTIVTDSEIFEVDLRECQAFPFEVSSMSLSILNKILSCNGGQLYSFKEKVGANAGSPKVYLLNAPYLGFEHIRIDNTGECADTWKISMPINSDQIGVSSVFRCRLGEFYINNVGGLDRMLGVSAMKNYPHLDLTRRWTDAEIYEHFDLTPEEIEYIESNVK